MAERSLNRTADHTCLKKTDTYRKKCTHQTNASKAVWMSKSHKQTHTSVSICNNSMITPVSARVSVMTEGYTDVF